MPLHDWTLVDAGTFHDFHQTWMVALSTALNNGVLPKGYFAMIEQRVGEPIADVGPPCALRADRDVYAARADQVTVHHGHGKVVAAIKVVSPGDKHGSRGFRNFVDESTYFILRGIHLLVIDLFPPTKRDPRGIANAICDEFDKHEMELPPGKPLTLSSYNAGSRRIAHFCPIGIGDVPPDVPLFIGPEHYVNAPLEASYQDAWRSFPKPLQELLVPGE